jgi:beta-lactam-binding protein with PASTA domain
VVYVIVSEGPELMKTPGSWAHPGGGPAVCSATSTSSSKKTVLVPHSKAGKVTRAVPAEGTDILEYGKVTLFVGTAPRSYYLMADTRNINYNEIADELEAKGIKYRINYARTDQASARGGIEYSILPERYSVRRRRSSSISTSHEAL